MLLAWKIIQKTPSMKLVFQTGKLRHSTQENFQRIYSGFEAPEAGQSPMDLASYDLGR
jgi:hypothetical protein